jgi:glycosyltransferase involved in cell wall biosynthesis
MAAGLPVITTDRGAIAETVVDGESGYVLAEPEPRDLARYMRQLIDDGPGRTAMGRSARERFEQHYAQEVADRNLAEWLARVEAGVAEPLRGDP